MALSTRWDHQNQPPKYEHDGTYGRVPAWAAESSRPNSLHLDPTCDNLHANSSLYCGIRHRNEEEALLGKALVNYFIPKGTPAEICAGGDFHPHTTERDLYFAESAADTPDEMIFQEGGLLILVAKALVMGESASNPNCGE